MSILATGKERQRPHLGLPFEFVCRRKRLHRTIRKEHEI